MKSELFELIDQTLSDIMNCTTGLLVAVIENSDEQTSQSVLTLKKEFDSIREKRLKLVQQFISSNDDEDEDENDEPY